MVKEALAKWFLRWRSVRGGQLLLLFSLFFLSGSHFIYGQAGLEKAIGAFVKLPALKHAGVGICVIDVASGKVVASREPDRSLVPASTLKVVTTATALALLGPHYRFRTELQHDGTIDSRGHLRGNLYLKGYGDPTLGSGKMPGTPGLKSILEKFRLLVQQRGIRRIEGYVVGDGTYFDTTVSSSGWGWNDLGNYYAAGAWGLNIHENLYFLRFQQVNALGRTPRIVSIDPEVPGLVFTNEVRSAARGSGDNAYIYGGPYTYERTVRGTIPIGSGLFTIKGSLPDAPLFAAQQLVQELGRAGIRSDHGAATQFELQRRGEGREGRRMLAAHQSPPLRDIVRQTNVESVNLYSEVMLRHIGQARLRKGNPDAGLTAIQQVWKDRGLSMEGCFLDDGSGLSMRNAVTARFLAGLLRKVAIDKNIFDHFYTSLPAPGQSGILKNRLTGTVAVGRLRAKSGTLERVRTYAGYARTSTGKLLAFALLVNNYTGPGEVVRGELEKVMLEMCK